MSNSSLIDDKTFSSWFFYCEFFGNVFVIFIVWFIVWYLFIFWVICSVFFGKNIVFLYSCILNFTTKCLKKIFAYNDTQLWNALPPIDIRSEENTEVFKKRLETSLFDGMIDWIWTHSNLRNVFFMSVNIRATSLRLL